MKHDIFVSYRRTDREFAAALVRRLEMRGLQVWYDADIEGGADWREVIVDALTNSGMLVILFSEDCNSSKQLKKELAVADALDKPVVPILIEDAQPKGAYLYELADRNWIQAWPDAMSRLDELVDLLAGLAGKGAPPPAEKKRAEKAPAANDTLPLPANDESAPAPVAAEFVGKVNRSGKKIPTNDILPFKWYELLVLTPLLAASAWYLIYPQNFFGAEQENVRPFAVVVLTLTALQLYGAVIFPVRYFLRGRPVARALRNFLISSLILYVVAVGIVLAVEMQAGRGMAAVVEVAGAYGIVWLGFTVIAFLIYGGLSAQRALARFRSNIRKI
jgi:hypothetical protein